jgi:hypothetical protein
MPFNLIKVYNQLLEIGSFNSYQRKESLKGIFNRDIKDNPNFKFRCKQINPTPKDGEIPMETLFTHLTTKIVDEKTKKREFERERSIRLHWVKHHIDEKEKEGMLVFSTKDKNGLRTYIYDKREFYVIVLEPYRNGTEYYLLSAYHLQGRDKYKIENKYKRAIK